MVALGWRIAAVTVTLLWLVTIGWAWYVTARVGDSGIGLQLTSFAPRSVAPGQEGVPIVAVTPGSPAHRAGIRTGDTLLAVDGVPAADTARLSALIIGLRTGNTAVLRVRPPAPGSPPSLGAPGAPVGSGGPERDVPVVLESRLDQPAARSVLVTYGAAGLMTLIVVIPVVLARPNDRPARVLLVTGGAAALWQAIDSGYGGLRDRWLPLGWDPVDQAGYIIALVNAIGILHFFLVFPAPLAPVRWLDRLGPAAVRRARGATSLLYLVPIGVTVVLFAQHHSPVAMLWTLVAVVLALAIVALGVSYARPATPLARAQLRWIFIGMGIVSVLLAGGPLVQVATGGRVVLISWAFTVSGWGLFYLAMALAILRYRLLDVDRVLRSALLLPLLVLGVVLVYALADLALANAANLVFGPMGDNDLRHLVAAVVAAAGYSPMRRRLSATLDAAIHREGREIRRYAVEAMEGLSRARPAEDVLRLLTTGAARAMDLPGAWVIRQPGSLEGIAGTVPPSLVVAGAEFTVPAGGEASHILILTARLGALEGTIRDATTREPLDNAVVQVTAPSGALLATITTGTDGHYGVITDLFAGTYSIAVTRAGYLGTGMDATVRANQTTVADAELVQLGQSISGLVLDRVTGRPIPGASVTLTNTTSTGNSQSTTSTPGQFAFTGIPAGGYSPTASADGYTTITASSAGVSLPAGATVVQNLLLQPPAIPFTAGLTGIVSDQATGQPIPDAAVQVYDVSGALAGSSTTDQDGRYLFNPFPAGQYTVTGWAFGYPDVVNSSVTVPPRTLAQRDLVLVPLSGSLTGIVLDEATGLAIPGALVEVTWPTGPARTAITGSSGGFAFTSAPPGSYTLSAGAQGYVSGPSSSGQAAVPLNGTASATMQLTPEPGGIFGIVTDARTGEPVPGATIQLLNASGSVLDTLTASPDGSYRTEVLPPFLTYGLRFSAPEYVPVSSRGTTTAGRLTEVNAALVPSASALSGIVLDRDTRRPIPDAAVTLIGPTGSVIASTIADSNGGFAFMPPGPGLYVVEAGPPTSGPAAGGYFTIAASSRPVVVVADREASVLLELAQQPAALTGVVVDATTGEPLAGATVTIRGGPAGQEFTITSADDGTWRISPIPAGHYRGSASLAGYWPSTGNVAVAPGQTAFLRLALANARNHLGGVARDVAGRPVVAASVILQCPLPSGDTAVAGTTRTDAGGNFALPLEPNALSRITGTGCTLVAVHPDYYPMQPVPVSLPGLGQEAPFTTLILAGKPATLRITTVDDRTGRIISDVDVAVTHAATGQPIRSLRTDQTGFVVVDGLNPDDYRILATKTGYAPKELEVYAGPNRTIEMRLRLSLALTGIVTDIRTGEVIPYARVTLFRLGEPTEPGDGRSRRAAQELVSRAEGVIVLGASLAANDTRFALIDPAGRNQRGHVIGTAVADERGKFWFDILDEGDYRAFAEAPGWIDIEESDDSGNVTIEGPVLVIPLKLTRIVEAPVLPGRTLLPNTGGGWLAEIR